jgi:hypothetical protein
MPATCLVHGFHPSGSKGPQSSQFDSWIPWIVKAEPKNCGIGGELLDWGITGNMGG